MPAIRVLPDLLVNKIAAGEVVERPASVVKELLENAIDAGAKHVAVTIEDGGKQLIRVDDDGCGMSANDLRLAIAPHATSKLGQEEDLYRIGTLGFRGEALASIGAVSRLRIISRLHDCDEAAEIRVSGDQIESFTAAGAPPGTSVEIRDLFFNVPARRKFLRANATEVGHVNDQFFRIALAHADIGFELTNNNRVTQRLSAGQDRLERIESLMSVELAEQLIHIEREEQGLYIEGFAAPPAHTKPTAAGQFVFINGRFIRDRILNYAIREAYRGLMEHNRYPVVFLFLEIDPSQVDVNVHPTKIEVRWQDTNLVRSQVLSALRETFLRSDLTPDLLPSGGSGAINAAERDEIRRTIAEQMKTAFTSSQPTGSTSVPGHLDSRPTGSSRQKIDPGPGSGILSERGGHSIPGQAAPDLWRSLYGASSGISPLPPSNPIETDDASPDFLAIGRLKGGEDSPEQAMAQGDQRPSIQLHNTYLVTETSDGFMIIDQHALHERILYEQFRRRITEGPLESQRLLLPETLTVSPSEQARLDENRELLAKLGIEINAFGQDAVAIQSFPVILANADIRGFVRDLIDKLVVTDDQAHPEVLIHEVLDMMACKAAVKAGDPLTPEEIEALIAQRDSVEKSSNCPHGRPTTLQLGLRDLERQFKRT